MTDRDGLATARLATSDADTNSPASHVAMSMAVGSACALLCCALTTLDMQLRALTGTAGSGPSAFSIGAGVERIDVAFKTHRGRHIYEMVLSMAYDLASRESAARPPLTFTSRTEEPDLPILPILGCLALGIVVGFYAGRAYGRLVRRMAIGRSDAHKLAYSASWRGFAGISTIVFTAGFVVVFLRS